MTAIDLTDTADTGLAGLVRPQPLGVLDGPAGLLLAGPGDGVPELLADLATGRLPASWPRAAAHIERALAGDIVGALDTLGGGRDDDINRFVLAPTPVHLDAARAGAGDDPRRRVVVVAAAYASGLSDEAPEIGDLDGEFVVLALTVRAARAMEFKDAPGAARALRAAADAAASVGPALEGRVLGMLAEHTFRTERRVEAALEPYAEAVRLLTGTDLDELRAGLQLEYGMALHQVADSQPHLLLEAVRAYQAAAMALTRERDPERFAVANMHIGIAILAMPASDSSAHVRLGVAVQSLRAALEVFEPGTQPWEWSSCQMNLANALQYLPSTHRQANLQEAVDLYEEVVRHRSPRSDPAGYARVLANQANALGHLAMFDDAVERYVEARRLFAAVGEPEAVEVIDRQLTEIDEIRGATR